MTEKAQNLEDFLQRIVYLESFENDESEEVLPDKTKSRRVFDLVVDRNGNKVIKRISGRRINQLHIICGYSWLVKHGKAFEQSKGRSTRKFRKTRRGGKAKRLSKDYPDFDYYYQRHRSKGLMGARALVKKSNPAIPTKEEMLEFDIPKKWCQ